MTETEIRTNYITPAIRQAGWEMGSMVREEFPITAGRIVLEKSHCRREKSLSADYVLFYKPNKPIAVIEAKNNQHSVSDGMQQALKYADMLDVPFVFSSNGDGFLFHNKYITEGEKERCLSNEEFPSPETLWGWYLEENPIWPKVDAVQNVPYHVENPNKQPRYYQINAINKTVEAIAAGQNRLLLVMATGTGKTYTAFQIIWRLWRAGIKKRILFLADRTALISQTYTNDFAPFKESMLWVRKDNFDTAHEIYLALYQGLTSEDEDAATLFRQFSPDFFDLVVVDECHRGSAKEESRWREVLEYFSSAAQIGMTATPKETENVSNIDYFGEPIYVYSLKQGIEDGFLAPYRVIRVFTDRDIGGYTPYAGQTDDNGNLLENRTYGTADFDKNLNLPKRTSLVAKVVSDYLKKHDCRMDKTIFFCVDQEHADRMRTALVNENPDLMRENSRYVMRITANDEEGRSQLDNFRNLESPCPTLVTTSKLLTTGVDVPTVKNIVLDSTIRSMTEFKQIIGRGTRVREDLGKLYFTIFDFRDVTRLFADPDFDGPIEQDEDFDPFGNNVPSPPPRVTPGIPGQPREKLVLSEVPVRIAYQNVQILGPDGRMRTEDFAAYTRSRVRGRYVSLQDFLNAWSEADRTEIIIRELEEIGISFDDLKDLVQKDLDPFDLICHIVFDQPPLTRSERARNVQKRGYFAKYGSQAAQVLEALLKKYAENGIMDLENIDILKVDPFQKYGGLLEIVRLFGGREKYTQAVRELRNAIYELGTSL